MLDTTQTLVLIVIWTMPLWVMTSVMLWDAFSELWQEHRDAKRAKAERFARAELRFVEDERKWVATHTKECECATCIAPHQFNLDCPCFDCSAWSW